MHNSSFYEMFPFSFAEDVERELQRLNVSCKRCGLTYNEFRHTGKLCCPFCYETFKDIILKQVYTNGRPLQHYGRKQGVASSLRMEQAKQKDMQQQQALFHFLREKSIYKKNTFSSEKKEE